MTLRSAWLPGMRQKRISVIKASYGLSDNYLGQKLAGRDKIFVVDKEKKGFGPFVIEDWRLSSRSLQDLCKKEQFCNALVAPLVSSGATAVMGFLLIFGKTVPRTFIDNEVKIAGMIADQAAIAIRTTQLHGQNKQRGEQLNVLEQIALDITGELEIKELLKSIVQRAAELVQATGGVIDSYDETKKEIVPVASHGAPDFGNIKVDKERGIIKEIIRTKAPFAVANYYRWSKRQTSLDPYRLTASLGVPILSDRQLLGIIAVHDDKEGRSFREADKELLQRLANHAAVALENASAYAAEHETKEYLDRLVSSSLDGIIASDQDGYITIYNEGAERICGYRQDEILGQKTQIEKLYGDTGTVQNITHSLLKRGKLDNYETVLRAKNGQEIPIILSAILLKDKDGNNKGSVSFFKDLRPLRVTLDTITTVTRAHDLKRGIECLGRRHGKKPACYLLSHIAPGAQWPFHKSTGCLSDITHRITAMAAHAWKDI